ncbi:MAG: RluA family pseudouridine synthase [Alphaproteobacteria bacterium]
MSRDVRVAEVAAGQEGLRLDRFLADALPDLSRSRIKALILERHVTLGGAGGLDPSRKVKAGERYDVAVPPAAPAVPEAQAIPLEILYEDAQLVVIVKPAGLTVHPAPGNPDRTLVNALIAHCGASLSGIGGVARPGIVHRLDKDTSGVMVIAKTDAAHHALTAQFQGRTIERAYLALVWGVPRPASGRIEGAIGRSARDRKKMAVVARGGKAAATRYRTLRTFGQAAALVECRLETGRTHQIRVHMTHIGHPLVGDPVYGRARHRAAPELTPAARRMLDGFRRQALHAAVLGFDHPANGRRLRFEASLPSDFTNLLNGLEEIGKAP